MDCLRSETCWKTFKYFIILIVSTNHSYILCISWIIKCLIIIDARCKHEDSSLLLLISLSPPSPAHPTSRTSKWCFFCRFSDQKLKVLSSLLCVLHDFHFRYHHDHAKNEKIIRPRNRRVLCPSPEALSGNKLSFCYLELLRYFFF